MTRNDIKLIHSFLMLGSEVESVGGAKQSDVESVGGAKQAAM